jgi:hypothetical protein
MCAFRLEVIPGLVHLYACLLKQFLERLCPTILAALRFGGNPSITSAFVFLNRELSSIHTCPVKSTIRRYC